MRGSSRKRSGGTPFGIGSVFAMLLSLLLTIQVTLAYQATPPRSLSVGPGEALVELCDGTSLRPVILDFATGQIREVPSGKTGSAPKCPFCIAGMIVVPAMLPVLTFAVTILKADLPRPSPYRVHEVRRDFSHVIRGPPSPL